MVEMDMERILQVITDGVILVDDEERITYANPAAALLMGRSTEEMVGIPVQGMLACNSLTPLSDRMLALESRCLAHVRMPNGADRLVRLNTYRTEKGVQLIITEKGVLSEIEKRLLEDWVGLRDFLDNLRSVIITLDLEGRVTFVNTGGLHLLGYGPGDIVGLLGRDMVFEEDKTLYDEMLERVKAGAPEHLEMRIYAKDGTMRYMSMNNSMMTVPGREEGFILAIGQDRTEEKVYEEVIARRNELLEILLDWGVQTIRAEDPRMAFVDGFVRVAEHLGYGKAIAVMRDERGYDVIADHGGLRAKLDECRPFQRMVAETMEGEAMIYLDDVEEVCPGVGLPPSAIVMPMRGPEGEEAVSMIFSDSMIAHDLDEKNVMDIMAHNLENQFRFMVLKERLNDSMSRISLYNDILLHDIRNYVSPVHSYLELMSMNADSPEKVSRYLERAILYQERLNKFLDSISVLIRTRERTPLKPVQVIDAIERGMSITLGREPDAELVFDAEDREELTDVLVMADDLLPNIFMNILVNAAVSGKGRPVIITGEVQPEYEVCRIAIEDQGPGIEDERKKMIFQRSLTKGPIKGLGIGLVIVSELAHRYGGRVLVEDRVADDHSQGARFMVDLPLA
jgi:PAS domain S-box-containing protein